MPVRYTVVTGILLGSKSTGCGRSKPTTASIITLDYGGGLLCALLQFPTYAVQTTIKITFRSCACWVADDLCQDAELGVEPSVNSRSYDCLERLSFCKHPRTCNFVVYLLQALCA